MNMRKLTALLTVMTLICLTCPALAAVFSIGNTGMTLTLPAGMERDSLTRQEMEEGLVAYYYNDTLDVAVYIEDRDGYTNASLLEEASQDEDALQFGESVINGIDTVYAVYNITEDGETFLMIQYIIISDNDLVSICFYMDDGSASQAAADIMNTLTR